MSPRSSTLLAAALLGAALAPLAASAEAPVRSFPSHAIALQAIPVADTMAAPQVEPDRRHITLDGQSNFRDLGGYATADGHHVKWGVLYRSGELAELTPADYAKLKPLGIRTIFDLRDQGERTYQPTVWAAGPIDAFHSDKQATDTAAMMSAMGPGMDGAKARAMILQGFYDIAATKYAPEYKVIFQQLLQGKAPLLFHCTAGKDRTGVGSALILSALGVPRATIVQDYALTNQYLKPMKLAADNPSLKFMAGLPADAQQAMMAADPSYIEASFAAIEAKYGSVDNYLTTQLGVGPQQRARLRQLYLD